MCCIVLKILLVLFCQELKIMKVSRVILKSVFTAMAFIGTMSLTSAQSKSASVKENLEQLLSAKDSLLFYSVFTSCNTNTVESLLTKDFVFYHDHGYEQQTTVQSRNDFIERIKAICAKKAEGKNMRRELVKSNVQVLPINENRALQMGVQRFYISVSKEKEQLVEESKFSREWQKENGDWKMSKELDYLVNTKFNNNSSDSLYKEIAHMDSVLFNAFNNRDMETFKKCFAEDLEFYHDKGGLTDYSYTINSFKNTIDRNNGLRRELVQGSLEVYPIPGYGAMQIGAHTFCHPENGKMDCGTFKFVHIWKKINNEWKITRVVSYDH